MLQNAYFLAKIGADTPENERHFAKKVQKLAKSAAARASRRPAVVAEYVVVSAAREAIGPITLICIHTEINVLNYIVTL